MAGAVPIAANVAATSIARVVYELSGLVKYNLTKLAPVGRYASKSIEVLKVTLLLFQETT